MSALVRLLGQGVVMGVAVADSSTSTSPAPDSEHGATLPMAAADYLWTFADGPRRPPAGDAISTVAILSLLVYLCIGS